MPEHNPTHLQTSLIQKTIRGMIWAFSGAGAYTALKVATIAILARLLTPEDFGTVAAAALVIVFGEIFSQMGLGPCLVQLKEVEEDRLRTALTLSLGLGVLFGLIVYLAAPLISAFYRMPEVVQVCQVLSLCFPLRSASVVAESLLKRALDFRKIVTADIASYGIGYGLGGVVMAWWGFGLWSIVFGIVLQNALRMLILVSVQRHPWRLGLSPVALRRLFNVGGGFTLSNLFNVFALYGDNLVVGRWLGPAMLGLYTRSYNLMAVSVTLFGNVLSSVLFPAMSSLQGNEERLRLAYLRTVSFASTVMLPCSVVAFVMAPEIILTLLGPGWEGAVLPFRILCLGMYFRVGYKVGATLLQATGEVYAYASREGFYAFLVIAGTFFGQRWGLSGVSSAVLLALAVHFAVLSLSGMKRLGVNFRTFLHLHTQGLLLAIFCGSFAWGASSAFAHIRLPIPAVLFLTVATLTGSLAVLLLKFPSLTAGKNNLWTIEPLMKIIVPVTPTLRRMAGLGIKRV